MDPHRLKRHTRYLVIAVPLLGLILGACVPRSQGGSAIALEGGIIYATSPQGKVLALNPQQRRSGLAFPGAGEWVFPGDEGKGLGITYAQPVPSGDKLFVATFDGKVRVLSQVSGASRGEGPLFEDESLVATPVLAGNTLLIAGGNELHAVDATTGAERWERPFEARNRIWASPVVMGNKVIVGSLDRRLYAVSLDTGEGVWSFESGGSIASTPLVAGNTIFFGSFDGYLYAIGSDGQKVWASPFKAGAWVWSRPLYHEGTVYFGALDGMFYAVDATRGRERWRLGTGESIRAAPAVEAGLVVVATTGGTVYGVSPATGTEKWQSALDEGITVSADLVGYEGEVFISSAEGTVYALGATTGKRVWSFSLAEAVK